jgi:hypothetical protein
MLASTTAVIEMLNIHQQYHTIRTINSLQQKTHLVDFWLTLNSMQPAAFHSTMELNVVSK